jgi:hypothetical protein
MSKYSKYERRTPEARYKIDPAWAGIGFLMILIVPIVSGAGAVEVVSLAKSQGWAVMNELSGYIRLPDVLYTLPYISSVANYISSIPDFSALVLFFVIILLLLTGLLSFAYALTYRIIGPPRYKQNDAPAPRIKTKRYTR